MKILFASDTHLGFKPWGDFGQDILEACVKSPPVDVFVFGGDLVEPNTSVTLEDGLRMISRVPAEAKLWVVGNNDIEHLIGKTDNVPRDYAGMLQEIAQKYGIHVLDHQAISYENVAFVGNYGACDLSLWRTPVESHPEFPSTYEELRRMSEENFQKYLKCSVRELFDHCQKKLKGDIEIASQFEKMVVCTHVVPSPEFVVYGQSPLWDYKNAMRGWDDSKTERPIENASNLVLQTCGHTHRSSFTNRPWTPSKAPILNISGKDQPQYAEI